VSSRKAIAAGLNVSSARSVFAETTAEPWQVPPSAGHPSLAPDGPTYAQSVFVTGERSGTPRHVARPTFPTILRPGLKRGGHG
jgi:hypothetical protein